MDVGTGNYAGAAMSAVELAGMAAKELGIPADAVDLVGLGTAIAKGDVNGMQKFGAEVASDLIEHVPGMPSEMKDALQAGVQFAGGNTEKAKAEAAQFIDNVVEDLPLPDEIKTLGKMGAAYVSGDKEGLKQASMELAREVVGHLNLSPTMQNLFDAGMALAEGDTKTAAAKLGIPEEVLLGAIDVAKNKDKYLDELKKVASDPAARKAFTDKLVDTAVAQGPEFLAKQLGIDPKYVAMARTAVGIGQDVWQNKDAYMALRQGPGDQPGGAQGVRRDLRGRDADPPGRHAGAAAAGEVVPERPEGHAGRQQGSDCPHRAEQGRHQQPADRRRQGVPGRPEGGHQGGRRRRWPSRPWPSWASATRPWPPSRPSPRIRCGTAKKLAEQFAQQVGPGAGRPHQRRQRPARRATPSRPRPPAATSRRSCIPQFIRV